MNIGFKTFWNWCMMRKNIREDKLMKVKKILENGVMKFLNVCALLLVMQTANSACIWVAHQPEFPEEANKLKCNM